MIYARPYERPGKSAGPVLTLVYPDVHGGPGATDALQPLAMAVLAAHTPPDWNIRFYDERLEVVDFEEPTDLVAFSVMTFSARRAYLLAAEYRRRGVTVVMGGFHPTLLPEEVARYADVVVRGDAEGVWPRILDDFLAGCLKDSYDGGVCTDPALVRFDRSIFLKKRYSPLIPVQATRGCRYSCDFCCVHSFYGRHQLVRPAGAVLDEIRRIPKRLILFTDDNLLSGAKELDELLGGLRGMGKKWSCQVSIDVARDAGLVKDLARCGCLSVFVGFESMNSGNLELMGKAGNLGYGDYQAAVGVFRRAQVMVNGAFVFGYPEDNLDSVRSALDFANRSKLCLCHFNPLIPYPQTRLYERLKAQGRLRFDSWWTDSGFRFGQMMFYPQNVEGRDLAEACYRARLEFNSWSKLLYRSWDFEANSRNLWNWGAFWAANLISRREVRRKQGLCLGGDKGRSV